jgi:hypothetical protein
MYCFLHYKWKEYALPLGACVPVGREKQISSAYMGFHHGMPLVIHDVRRAVKKFLEFFDSNDLVPRKFVPPGQNVTGHFYIKVLQRLRDAVRRKRRDKWQGQWFKHHDNPPSHTPLVVQQLLAEKIIPVITQAPYSPDLNPTDVWLFSTLKTDLKGACFRTMEDSKWNMTAEIWTVAKEAFSRCLQQWQDRWSKSVCARVLL